MQIGDNLITAYGLFGVCGLMLLALFAAWPATIAFKKGKNFAAWYLFGFFLLPVAFVASLKIKNQYQQHNK